MRRGLACPLAGRTHMRRLTLLATMALVVVIGALPIGAQSFLGGIRGAVKDANGVIPAAQVVLTEQQTGATRSVETNAVGEYVFSAVTARTPTKQAAPARSKTLALTEIPLGIQKYRTRDQSPPAGALEA